MSLELYLRQVCTLKGAIDGVGIVATADVAGHLGR
jgi:hypothetical protein